MSTKPKAASQPLTPKQAEIKAVSLIRGIDNSVARIRKESASIADAASQLRRQVVPALSNAARKDKPVPAPKAAPKKDGSASAPKKDKPLAQNPSKTAQKVKPPVKGRPTVKEAIQAAIRDGGPISPADLWKKVVEKYGYWSHTSLYNALKDAKLFKKVDGVIQLVPGSGPKRGDDVDNFVDNVVADKSVAHAV